MATKPPKGKKGLVGMHTTETVNEDQPGFKARLLDAAAKEGLELAKPDSVVAAEGEEAIQQEHASRELFKPGESQAPPTTVINGHMATTYVKPHYDTDDEDLIVGMEFSIPLRKEHRGLIPKNVERAWDYLEETKETLVKINSENTRPQTVYVKLDPKDGDQKPNMLLHLTGTRIRSGIISVTVSKGTGKTIRDTRYSFQVVGEVCEDVCRFADYYYGKKLWLYMADTEPQSGDLLVNA